MGEFDDPNILDPATFNFFKGVNTAAQNGVLSADVTDGVPAGNYRLASINTDSNHAPAIAAVAQHGWLDDIIYVRQSHRLSIIFVFIGSLTNNLSTNFI